jgi:hypothetical protein
MDFFEELEEIAEAAAIENLAQPRHTHNGYGHGPSLGYNIENGDLVENLGNGLGIDLNNGQVDFELGNSGFDI